MLNRRVVPVYRHEVRLSCVKRIEGTVLVANYFVIILLESDLPPTYVPTQEGDVSTGGREGLDIVAHLRGPVLVVTHADQESIVLQEFAIFLDIALGAQFYSDPLPREPANQRNFPELPFLLRNIRRVRIRERIMRSAKRNAKGSRHLL